MGVIARPKSLRSQLYRAARDLGNVQAAERGPVSYGKRMVRRKVYRKSNTVVGHVMRVFKF
jgi:hypothetical protein